MGSVLRKIARALNEAGKSACFRVTAVLVVSLEVVQWVVWGNTRLVLLISLLQLCVAAVVMGAGTVFFLLRGAGAPPSHAPPAPDAAQARLPDAPSSRDRRGP